ncbi:hypothetical protein ACFX2C_018948 [Malus domestica]
MSNPKKNMVKMLPVRSSVWKFETGTVELILDLFGLLRRPHEQTRPRKQVGPREWVARLEQAGPQEQVAQREQVRPREWAARSVMHMGTRLRLGLAMH